MLKRLRAEPGSGSGPPFALHGPRARPARSQEAAAWKSAEQLRESGMLNCVNKILLMEQVKLL